MIAEQDVWTKLKECRDPELPCNIVDLGLVYSVRLTAPPAAAQPRVEVTMTLTTAQCPMATQIAAQVQRKLLELPGIAEASVQLVFDPPWNAARITAAGRKQLGLNAPGA